MSLLVLVTKPRKLEKLTAESAEAEICELDRVFVLEQDVLALEVPVSNVLVVQVVEGAGQLAEVAPSALFADAPVVLKPENEIGVTPDVLTDLIIMYENV